MIFKEKVWRPAVRKTAIWIYKKAYKIGHSRSLYRTILFQT